jgi:hypothetical protein
MSEQTAPPQNLIEGTPLEAKIQEVKNLLVGATSTRTLNRLYDNDFFSSSTRPDCVKDIYIEREVQKITNGGITIPQFIVGVYKKYLDATLKNNITVTLPCSNVSRKLVINIDGETPYLGFSHMTSVYKNNVAKLDGKTGYIVVNIMPLVQAQGHHFFRAFMGTVERSRSMVTKGLLLPGQYAVAVHGFYAVNDTTLKERFTESVNYCLRAPIESWDITEAEVPTVISGKSANPEVIVDDLLSNKKISIGVMDRAIDIYDTGLTDVDFATRMESFREVEDKLTYVPKESDFAKEPTNNSDIYIIEIP